MKMRLCALLVCVMTFCTGMAVPTAVDRQSDGQTITKTYELAPDENPELLIEEPFEQDGLCYEYAQMTEEPVETTESRTVSQTVTVESQNAETEENFALLAGSIPYEADGYAGTLTLLPASVRTEAKGYATRSYTVSDTRTYPDLAYNDPSLIPQTVQKDGLTLTLSGVTWKGTGGTGANGSLIPTSYTATASYSGTGSTRYATGYLTAADYAGTVTKQRHRRSSMKSSTAGRPSRNRNRRRKFPCPFGSPSARELSCWPVGQLGSPWRCGKGGKFRK